MRAVRPVVLDGDGVGMLAPAGAFPAAAEQDHGWDSDAGLQTGH